MTLNSESRPSGSEDTLKGTKVKQRPFWRRVGFYFRSEVPRKGSRSRVEIAQLRKSRQLPITYRGIPGLAAGLDAVLIIGVGLLSGVLYHQLVFGGPGPLRRDLAVAVFVAIIFVGVARHHRLYRPSQLLLWNVQLNNIIWIWCAAFFLLSGWVFVWKAGDDVSRGAVLLFWGLGLLILLPQRLLLRFCIERALKKNLLPGRQVVVIARSVAPNPSFDAELERNGYEVKRKFTVCGSSAKEVNNELARAVSYVRGSDVEEILLIARIGDMPKLGQIADQLRILPIPVTWIVDRPIAELVKQPWSELGQGAAIRMQRAPRNKVQRAMKRCVDIIGASGGLLLLLPLISLVALAIKYDSPGPILFWQTRRGFNGKPFKISKFRSLSVLEDGDDIKQVTKSDPRVTRVGAWIRKTSIDELPQLLNVLSGSMSLVGPRPHAVAHDDHFIETVANYAYRHHVKPGMTGWAQVHGFRGETSTLDQIQRRVDLDRWYINNWSVWLDFTIILRTLASVVPSENTY